MSEIYLAGKLAADAITIAELSAELEVRGHDVLAKW